MPVSTKRPYILKGRRHKAASLLKLAQFSNGHQSLKDKKNICLKILRNIKQKNLEKNNKQNKKEKKVFNKTIHFPSFLLLCNAISRVKDIEAIHFKIKFH